MVLQSVGSTVIDQMSASGSGNASRSQRPPRSALRNTPLVVPIKTTSGFAGWTVMACTLRLVGQAACQRLPALIAGGLAKDAAASSGSRTHRTRVHIGHLGHYALQPSVATSELYAPLWSCHKASPIGFGARPS